MKLKSLIYAFIFLIFTAGCNKSVIEPEANSPELPSTDGLKAATIGTKYYVAKTGNDKNAGTSTAPFLTIQKAADVVNPGDSVIIRNGTYSTSGENLVNLSRGGSAGNYVVFKAENKWGAILDGQGSTDVAWNIIYGASYLKFINLAVTRFATTGFQANHSGYIEQFITIQGNKIYEIGRTDNTEPYGICAIYTRVGNHDWSIDKNLIYNIGRTGPDSYYMNKDHAVYCGTPSVASGGGYRINVTNNVMYGISGATLNWGANDCLIANNVMAWRNENSQGASCFIAVDMDGISGLTIANNVFYQPPTSNPYAINGYAPYPGWSIKNNIVYGGSMWGSSSTERKATMTGGNYGQTDCENGQLNPLFVSAIRTSMSSADFNLQAGSPAINKGVNVGLTSDFLSKALSGLPDIGAYESGSGTTVPPVVVAPVVVPPVVVPPVVVPPVVAPSAAPIGLTTVGGASEKGDKGYWMTTSFTASSNTAVSRMNLYVGTASGNARLGIYSNNNGKPGTLLAQTGEIALSNGWNSGALGSTQNLTSGATYWMAIEVNSSTTTLYYNNVSGRQLYKSLAYGSLPSAAPRNCSNASSVYSVYAN